MKFVLLVEGSTERAALPRFLKRWLDERLPEPVGIRTERVADPEDLATKAENYIEARDAHKTIAVIGLLDLYGLKSIKRDGRSRDDYREHARKIVCRRFDNPKFRMFFAVHELEAWLLAQPENLPPEIRRSLPASASNPEDVDFDEPPSKMLKRLYREKLKRKYDKTIEGAELFSRLDPSKACARCPHLAAMLDEMLDLAQGAVG